MLPIFQNKSNKARSGDIFLVVVPLITLIAGLIFLTQLLPLYSGPNGLDLDPSYQYLLNGASILDGIAPGHTDHPGTPLQILAAIVIFLQWLVFSIFNPSDFSHGPIMDAIQNPELYIQTICIVLLGLNTWATYFVGKSIFKSSQMLSISLIIQFAPLAFWQFSPRLVYLSPEALLIFSSLILIGLLAKFIFPHKDKNIDSKKRIDLLKIGLICSIGITTKITFFPALLSLLLIRNWSHLSKIVLYILIFTALILIPIYSKFPWMLGWFYSLLTHSGIYGAGNNSFIDLSLLPSKFTQLINEIPLYFILITGQLLSIMVGLVIFNKNITRQISNKTLFQSNLFTGIIFFSIFLFQILIVLKHFRIHYMLPAIPFAFAGLSWALWSLKKIQSTPLKRLSFSLSCLFLLLLSFNSLQQTVFSYKDLRSERIVMNQSNASIISAINTFNNPIIVSAYRCHLIECALAFAGSYTSINPRLTGVLNNHFYFNIWNKKLLAFGFGYVDPSVLQPYLDSNANVLLISPPDYKELSLFNTTLITSDGTNSPYQQSLYRINSINQGMYK